MNERMIFKLDIYYIHIIIIVMMTTYYFFFKLLILYQSLNLLDLNNHHQIVHNDLIHDINYK